MNKAEAIQAMQDGKKVTHVSFTSDEWATMQNGKILLEDGVRCSPAEFWRWRTAAGFDNGWEEFITENKKTNE